MANLQTRVYRNDSDKTYNVQGLGEVLSGQRMTFQGEFPPAINLQNYPGLIDVLEEEENGTVRDYEKDPEPAYEPGKAGGSVAGESKGGSNNG